MSYDTSKLVKLGHLKDLATKIKNDYATKAELQAIKLPEYSVAKQGHRRGRLPVHLLPDQGRRPGRRENQHPQGLPGEQRRHPGVETADDPYEGAQVGDLYIDFVINAKGGGDTATHIYLPVNELVDAYTGGNGIEVSAQNLISAKIDTANANGLAVTTAGFKLDLATTSTAGAMSAADKTKLDGIAAGATKVEKSETNGNVKINGEEKTVYTHPEHTAKESGFYKVTVDAQGHVSGAEAVTKEDITGLGIPGQDTTYQKATQQADGLMSKEDKVKLDGMVVAGDGEVTEMLNEVFAASPGGGEEA